MLPAPDRNLSLDLVRVTEAAALAAGRHLGLGDAVTSEKAATDAMTIMLATVGMEGAIVVGQTGPAADPLPKGARVGNGDGPAMDVAVDPVEGVELLSQGRANALSVIAAAERGCLYDPGPVSYMEKIAVGPAAARAIDITQSVERNLRAIARANRKDMNDLTVVVLDRPRHAGLVDEIRATGARIRLLVHGDVAGALMTSFGEAGIDALIGTGGAGEAVMAACALRCLGGAIQARPVARDEAEGRALAAAGVDTARVLTTEDLAAGGNVFFAATGISSGELLRGVHYDGTGARTHSLSMRSLSGTVRVVEARHRWDKLMQISRVSYDRR